MYQNRGNMTVEVVLVLSVIIFCLYIIIMLVFLFYQQALVANLSAEAARYGVKIWKDESYWLEEGTSNPGAELTSFYVDFKELLTLSSLVYNGTYDTEGRLVDEFTEGSSSKNTRLGTLVLYCMNKLGKGVIKPEATNIRVRFDNALVKKTITVKIEQKVRLPIGFLKKLLNGSEALTVSGEGIAAITDPAEFIRNVDLAVELARSSLPLNPAGLIDKVRGALGKGVN